MVSILMPIVDNPRAFLESIRLVSATNKVVVGVTKSLAKDFLNLPYVSVNVFKDGSDREEILNALQAEIEEGSSVLIARKPFTKEEFDKFTRSGAQIAVCEKKRNAFSNMLFKIWSFLIKHIFGVKLFEGDTSLIYFNEDLSSVLHMVKNLSYCTRVDRWKGTTQEMISTASPPIKVGKNAKDLLFLLFAFLTLAIGVVVTAVVAVYTNVSVLIGLILACLDLLCLAVSLMLVFAFVFNVEVGRKNISSVEELSLDEINLGGKNE